MPGQKSTELTAANHGLALSEAQVLGLLEGKSPHALTLVTRKIAGAYGQEMLTTQDVRAAEHIFRLLVRETQTQVRQALAENIKNSLTIPRDIIMTLAQDVAEVSLPILESSQVLEDADLLELIKGSKDTRRQVAISRRSAVSQQVSDALLSQKHDEVTSALLGNSGAVLSEDALLAIVANHKGNDNIMKSLGSRPQLPVGVAEKLVHVVSAQMGEALKKKNQLPAGDIELEVEKTRESETLRLIRNTRHFEDTDKLINQLMAFGRLSPSLILSSLCQGSVLFFETALARLSGIPVANARTLIKDRGDLGFRAIYNRSGLPDTLFPAVRLLLKCVARLASDNIEPGTPRYSNTLAADILKQSEISPVENLSYIVALVRRSA